MIPNTNSIICGETLSTLKPFSELIKLQMVPFCFQRITDSSFLYCDAKDGLATNLLEFSINQQGQVIKKSVEEFMGIYQYCSFGEDSLFLINKEGDIVFYNLNNKNSHFVQKQHPSLFHPLQVHNVASTFVTCGGNVTTSFTENQKIIKVWQFNEEQLINEARIVTGHSKSIQNSFIIGRNKIASLSTDKTIRLSNLSTQQIDQIIPVSTDYYSGYPLDWNTALLGGTGKSLDIFDTRSKKLILNHLLKQSIIQVCEIARLSHSTFIFANVNQIYSFDIRKLQAQKKGQYEGERISRIKAISRDSLIIGNRDRTMQVWRYF